MYIIELDFGVNKQYLKSILKHSHIANRWSFNKNPAGVSWAQVRPNIFRHRRAGVEKSQNSMLGSITGFKGVYYFATARMGLYWFLNNHGIGENDKVAIQAFNCAVVPDAIIKTGATPVYLDIQTESLTPSKQAIKQVISNNAVKALVLQNSFGFLSRYEISELRELRPDLLIILDSSLSFGLDPIVWAEYSEFDAVMLSFDLSKPLAIISGGVMLTPSCYEDDRTRYISLPPLSKEASKYLMKKLRSVWIFGRHDGFFSLLNYVTYGIRGLIFTNRFKGFEEGMTAPNVWPSCYEYPSKIPEYIPSILEEKLKIWQEEEIVKKDFAKFVINTLRDNDMCNALPEHYMQHSDRWVPLRVPLIIKNRSGFVRAWGEYYRVDQWWFMEPIISCFQMSDFGYNTSSCPIAEKICQNIVNFPVPNSTYELALYKVGFIKFIDRLKNA
jgi:perosamine synthetase